MLVSHFCVAILVECVNRVVSGGFGETGSSDVYVPESMIDTGGVMLEMGDLEVCLDDVWILFDRIVVSSIEIFSANPSCPRASVQTVSLSVLVD